MSDFAPEPDEEAAGRFRDFLAGLPADPAALLAALEELKTAEEVELAARGIRPVSVVHGDAESAADEALIFGELPRLARDAGHFRVTRGGNDYTTWFFDGPDGGAEQACVAFIAAVTAIARPWWIVTPTAQPKFYR